MIASEVASLAASHLRISLLALALGSLVAIPLGLVAARKTRLERVVLATASVVQTIPGLALLAVMVPALAALGHVLGARVPSIGELPAVLALSAYAVLPILRGVVLGISGLDPAVIEAAEAVGMTARQRRVLVEVPLALPHIVGGARTAIVWTVGMATLATPVGARSLGELIFGGLQTRHYDEVLVGCVASAVLAIALDGLVRAAEVRARRRGMNGPLIVLGALAVWAVVATAAGAVHGQRPIRVGAKPFTEQRVLGALLEQTIEKTGAKAVVLPSLGTNVAFDALVSGEIDTYVEYTGTIWTALMGRTDVPSNRATIRQEVERWLQQQHGVTIVATLGFENTYALVVRASQPYTRISDLGTASTLVLATDYELPSRPEWQALRKIYGLHFAEQHPMDPSLLYEAVANGAADVATGYSTDARIGELDLKALVDDHGAIPPYDAVVLVRKSFEADHPAIVAALHALDGSVDAAHMRAASAAVDASRESPATAVRLLEHPR